MAKMSGFVRRPVVHIILVPGFGAFDALGQVEYYAGITSLFQSWKEHNTNTGRAPLLRQSTYRSGIYACRTFANLLRQAHCSRRDSGDDKIVLVGHSTGGLDIRQVICDLHEPENESPSGRRWERRAQPAHSRVPECRGFPFRSSLGHQHRRLGVLTPCLARHGCRRVARCGSGFATVPAGCDRSQIAGGAASLTDAEMLLALQDALTEANEHYGKPGPLRTADAQEAASELELYFRQMASDFHVINDLTSQSHDPKHKSPAHFNEEERRKELALWDDPPIETLSYVTVGGRPFRFPSRPPCAGLGAHLPAYLP